MKLNCMHEFKVKDLQKQIINSSYKNSACKICGELISLDIILKIRYNSEKQLERRWLTLKTKINKYPFLNVLFDLTFMELFEYNLLNKYSIKKLLKLYSYNVLDNALWTMEYVVKDMTHYHCKSSTVK